MANGASDIYDSLARLNAEARDKEVNRFHLKCPVHYNSVMLCDPEFEYTTIDFLINASNCQITPKLIS